MAKTTKRKLSKGKGGKEEGREKVKRIKKDTKEDLNGVGNTGSSIPGTVTDNKLITKLESSLQWLKATNAEKDGSSQEEIVLEECKLIEIDAIKAKEDGKDVLRGNEQLWTKYVRCVLKICLRSDVVVADRVRAAYLAAMEKLCVMRYSADKSQVKLIYEMITGHSNFLSTLLEGPKCPRDALLSLMCSLCRLDPGAVCSSTHLPVLLGAYGGTLSEADQCVLEMLYLHETNGTSLGTYRPCLWGKVAVEHYRGGARASSLSKIPKVSEVLALIDAKRMEKTATNFPITLELTPMSSNNCYFGHDLYDPRFFLPLLSQICSPGMFVDRHLRLMESGSMALVFSSLSSRDKNMRSLGYTVLSRMYSQLEAAKLTEEKKVWLHVVDLVRNGCRGNNNNKSSASLTRIPSIVAVFLARLCKIFRTPLDPMYKSLSSFVLAKPVLDLFRVPEFLRLFHSREPNHAVERHWVLEVIRDGMRDEMDFSVAQKELFLKMLMTFHDSVLADGESKVLIRQVLLRAVSMEQPAFDLVKNHGLLTWISSILTNDESAIDCCKISCQAWRSVSRAEKVPASVVSEFALVFGKLAKKKSNFEETTSADLDECYQMTKGLRK